ncbi:chemotaxis protein CheW [Vibrio sp. D431a]|uniref:chemotaxis protein CheW n=1 Tax=Vibrio sp. D431a TaxID=2837388 RepID=UPI0025571ADF|nr:chemotaxis protein CheW [Vibrio sp. D431a]MDK9793287.1 chemotaxis protein CheW [Vibrio sp. D431a]
MSKQTENIEQRMAFEVSGEIYAVDVLAVKEVLRFSMITPIPRSLSFVLGLINLRGNVVTIIDGRKRLNVAEGEITDETRIIIIDGQEHPIGIVVDSVREVIDIDREKIEPSSSNNQEEQSFIQGIYHLHDELHILIDHATLLSE